MRCGWGAASPYVLHRSDVGRTPKGTVLLSETHLGVQGVVSICRWGTVYSFIVKVNQVSSSNVAKFFSFKNFILLKI